MSVLPHSPMNSVTQLHGHLQSWNRRLRIRRTLRWGWYGLGGGLILNLAFSLPEIINSRLVINAFYSRSLIFSATGVLFAILVGYLWPLSMKTTSRFLDQKYSLADRVSTANELLTSDSLHKNPLTIQQRIDTINHLRGIQPQFEITPQARWKLLAFAFLWILILLGGPAIWKDNFHQAEERAMFTKAIATESDRLDSLVSSLETDPTISSDQREQLAAPLRSALAALEDVSNLEQAVAALTQAEEELEAVGEQQAAGDRLRNFGQGLAESAYSPLDQFIENLSGGDFPQAAADLEAVATDIARENYGDMAGILEELAVQARAEKLGLAEPLGEAADAFRAGDPVAAADALTNAAEEIRNTSPVPSPEIASSLAADLQASQERLYGELGAEGMLSGSNLPPGASTAQGVNPFGEDTQQGGNLAPGRGEGEPPGFISEGPSALPNNPQNSPGDGGLADPPQIYAPIRLDGEAGPQVVLPESGREGEPINGPESPGALPEPELSQVPYEDVYAQYAAIYRQALETGRIPTHLRELVRRYFTSLDPD